MITNGENAIRRVLALLPDGTTGAPCGACREMMAQLMPGKYQSVEIMLDYEQRRIATLGELTPEWWLLWMSASAAALWIATRRKMRQK